MSTARAEMLRRSAAIASALALSAMAGAACSRGPITVTLPTVPSTLTLRTFPPSTLGPDFSVESIPPETRLAPPVPSTIGFDDGQVTLSGQVTGPDGPVGGATVRVERLVGDQIASLDAVTNDDGRYLLERVRAGRVRLRAWKAPALAAVEPTVLFASGTTNADLRVTGYGGSSVQWGVAPRPMYIGRPISVVVQVTQQVVDAEGVVRPAPVAGVGVTVTPLGRLQSDTLQEVVTNAEGRLQVTMRCSTAGPSTLLVALATGEQASIDPPNCMSPPTTVVATVPVVAPTVQTSVVDAASTVPVSPPVDNTAVPVPAGDAVTTSSSPGVIVVPVPVIAQP